MYVKRVLPNGVRHDYRASRQRAHGIGRHLGRQRQPIRTGGARTAYRTSSST
ncbi:MAG: hypothetical protein ACLR4Z_12035 [Butyricicoccaceae bacterium]